MADSGINEIYLRCGCGNEVMVIEHDTDGVDDYILSLRTIPIKVTWRTKLRKIWQTLQDGFNYELILTGKDMKQLKSWLEEQEGVDNGKDNI